LDRMSTSKLRSLEKAERTGNSQDVNFRVARQGRVAAPSVFSARVRAKDRRAAEDGSCMGEFGGDGFDGVGFDDVADFKVLIAGDLEAALVAFGDFADVVFEAAERFEFAFEDDRLIAQDADFAAARDLAVFDVAAGDGADLADLEDLAHFGVSERDFALYRREHAAHGLLEIVFDFVDDLVEAKVDTFVVRKAFDRLVGPDVEADKHRVGCAGKVDVVRRNGTDAAVNHADVDFFGRERLHARAQRFNGALTIGFDDDVERLLAFGRHGHEGLGRDALSAAGGDANVAPARLALFGGFACDAFVADDHQRIAGGGHFLQTHDLDGNGRAGLLDLLALVVDECAHLTERAADDDDVADAQRAVLDEHRRDGAAPLVQRGFNNDAGCAPGLIRL